LSLRVTVKPLVGAAPFMVTVPVEEVPPPTYVGLRTRLVMAGGLIAIVAIFDPEL